jgi:hypothetical protein
MEIKKFVGVVIGAFFALLGLLWFVQGVGLLQVCPVVCVRECECLTGSSLFWAVAGALLFIVGIAIAVVSMRRFGTSSKSELDNHFQSFTPFYERRNRSMSQVRYVPVLKYPIQYGLLSRDRGLAEYTEYARYSQIYRHRQENRPRVRKRKPIFSWAPYVWK